MDKRNGYCWVVKMRPIMDKSGKSDFVVVTFSKDRSRRWAEECGGELYDLVYERWMKFYSGNEKTLTLVENIQGREINKKRFLKRRDSIKEII